MNVLLLAPQPFYSERGTPIAVYNLAKVLGEAGYDIDLMTFPGGEDVSLQNTQIIRVGKWLPFLGSLPVGFSIRKLLLDVVMLFAALSLTRRKHYAVIHAVEESVFIALACARSGRKQADNGPRPKVVYDMDSSMSDQLIERRAWLSPLRGLLDACEHFAIKNASHVLAVCQALKDKAEQAASDTPITVVEDISSNAISDGNDDAAKQIDDIRLHLPNYPIKLLYVGNLEPYQGVGTVVEAMAQSITPASVGFLVIGGNPADIASHQQQAKDLGIADRVEFLGPRPVKYLAEYLAQADILVSPRTKGVNTPMKIYTYLGAGKAIIATDIFSHTQVLDENNACLVPPTGSGIAGGIKHLLEDADYSQKIASQAQHDAENRYSFKRFRERILALYQAL